MPLGALVLTILVITVATIGRRQRQPLAQLSGTTFGLGLGALLINLIMGVGMMGWGGFQFGLTGVSLANLLNWYLWVGVLIMGLTVLGLSQLHINRWNAMIWITTTSSLALAVVALIVVTRWETEITPTTAPFSLSAAFWVIGSVVAYGGLFNLRVPDFAWDVQSNRDILIDGFLLFITLIVSLFIGMLLFRTTGDWNLAEIFADTSLAWLGHLFLILSLISPTLGSMYSGGLAWKQVLRISHQQGTALCISVGVLLGVTRFDRQLLPFLDWIGAVAPPASAIIIAVALIKRVVPTRFALIAWGVGSIVGLFFKINGEIIYLLIGAGTSLVILGIQLIISKDTPSK